MPVGGEQEMGGGFPLLMKLPYLRQNSGVSNTITV